MSDQKKKPIQIYLRDDQMKSLRVIAEKRGESLASLIRQGVDKLLDELPPEEDPLNNIVGLYSSPEVDQAENHDDYIEEAIIEDIKDEA